MAIRAENAIQSASRLPGAAKKDPENEAAAGAVSQRKNVYPTDQSERKGLDRKDEEKLAHFQLGHHFEHLWKHQCSDDDDGEESQTNTKTQRRDK